MIAYICSRYNGYFTERRANLVEHDALCRWAMAQGYAVVSWAVGLDRDNPPEDTPEVREAAQARDWELLRVVGACPDGEIVVPLWYAQTAGMAADREAAKAAGHHGYAAGVYLESVLPFVPVPWRAAIEARARGDEWRGLVPGAPVAETAVKRAMGRIMALSREHHLSWERDDIEQCAHIIAEETGVEVE